MTREQTKTSLDSEAAAPALGAYRHCRLPSFYSDFLERPADYRSPLGRTVLARFRSEWAAADRLEQHDRIEAAKAEYLPADEQLAYWQTCGMSWRNVQASYALGGGEV
jgi:hypothetical protein